MTELLSRIPEGGAWTVTVIFIVLVFGAPAVLSEEGAKKLWVIKKLSSGFRNRRERSVQREIRYTDLQAKSFNQRLALLEEAHKADLHRLQEQFTRLEEDFHRERERWEAMKRNLQKELEESLNYRDYLISWIRKARLLAVENDWEPPLDEFHPLEEWLISNLHNQSQEE